MNPVLHQIKTDESVWPDGATHCIDGDFIKWVDGGEYSWLSEEGEWKCEDESWTLEKYEESSLRFNIISRPTKEDGDWLQVNSKVTTPKGTATVNKITEDDGVFTTLGNYCRSELSPTKAEWVPKVGDECEVWVENVKYWAKVKVLAVDKDTLVWRNGTDRKSYRGTHISNARPIKSDRDKFVEAYKEIEAEAASKQGRLVDALYDSGKFKLVEVEK